MGSYLSEKDCNILDKIRQISDSGEGYISDLRNCIYNLPYDAIKDIKNSGTVDGIEDKPIGSLDDLQTLGVAYMYFAKRLVLGDSVGLGKTVEVCGLFNLLQAECLSRNEEFRFLYLTEKPLVEETRDKLIKFTGEYVYALYGQKPKIQRFLRDNQMFLRYSIVGSHSLLTSVDFQNYLIDAYESLGEIPFDILVIDEADTVISSNRKKGEFKAARILSDMFDRIIILNATPFGKNLSTFYNQIDIIDDSFLPTQTYFNKRYVVYDYTGPYPRASGKYKNAEEFKNLVSYRYFARTRKDSGAKMEGCTAEVIVSDLTQEQKELLKLVSIPNMVYDCPGYFYNGDYETTIENTPKLRDVLRLTGDLVDKGESVLIYAFYKEAQEAIQNILFSYGIECEVMNGETKISEKNFLVDRFKAGDLKVLITNVQRGLDFGNCNYCIFYSYDTNPNRMVQFEGRMTREYNIIGKHVYLLVSRGKELQKLKKIVADRAIASDLFAGSDFSCVLSLLLDSEKLQNLK